MEPKGIPRCFVPHLLVVFNRQLEILATPYTGQNEIQDKTFLT